MVVLLHRPSFAFKKYAVNKRMAECSRKATFSHIRHNDCSKLRTNSFKPLESTLSNRHDDADEFILLSPVVLGEDIGESSSLQREIIDKSPEFPSFLPRNSLHHEHIDQKVASAPATNEIVRPIALRCSPKQPPCTENVYAKANCCPSTPKTLDNFRSKVEDTPPCTPCSSTRAPIFDTPPPPIQNISYDEYSSKELTSDIMLPIL